MAGHGGVLYRTLTRCLGGIVGAGFPIPPAVHLHGTLGGLSLLVPPFPRHTLTWYPGGIVTAGSPIPPPYEYMLELSHAHIWRKIMSREHDLDGRFKQLGDQRRYARTLTVSNRIWWQFGRLAEQRGGGFSRSDLLEEWVQEAVQEPKKTEPKREVPPDSNLPPKEQVLAKVGEILKAKKGAKASLEKLVDFLYPDHALTR